MSQVERALAASIPPNVMGKALSQAGRPQAARKANVALVTL